MTYAESTLRRKAREIGYEIQKGFVHQLTSDYPVADREVGYNILDITAGSLVPECHNTVYDHLLTLEGVGEFLETIYLDNGLDW